MEMFNINAVIERYNLNTDELAKVLFPSVKYPKQAFDRIIKGEADLDVKQLQALASHIGVHVSELFTSNQWKGTTEDNCLTFIKGEFRVKLNYNNVFMTIYKNGTRVDQIIGNVPNMTVEQFTNYIDNLIKKY